MSKKYQEYMVKLLDEIAKIISVMKKRHNDAESDMWLQTITECMEAMCALERNAQKYHQDNAELKSTINQGKELLQQLQETVAVKEGITDTIIMLNDWVEGANEIVRELLSGYCEVLFLPYKASMWDSLESVWRAVSKQEGCKAYVMPIPYYAKNQDGGFSEWHYEGDCFPDYVPILNYKEWELSDLRPDIIFIHNPYDSCNRVTSVHPGYYTTKIKKYTDLLVYIPYYVSSECNPDSMEVMKAREGFCMTPGVLNSDYVVLQSDNVKKLFVNILEKNMPDVPRRHWENKILGLGSPKLDCVNTTLRNDNRLPDDWKRIIYDKSGQRKKVIFYNTSLAALLQQENILGKIKDVLNSFEKNQDIVLWWRPHPLYESTLESMRPNMLEEYKHIVSAYRNGGWGIYDDGKDLEWAIAETDAYYGDKSSVVQLYKEANKPVMIQNASIRHNIEYTDVPIWPSTFCVDGDDIWFAHGMINALMRYNVKEKTTYMEATIPDEPPFQGDLYSGIHKWGNHIYMIPCWARKIVIYDISAQTIKQIELNDIEAYQERLLFRRTFVEGKHLYCVPYYYHAILKIDMETGMVQYAPIRLGEGECINDVTRNDGEIIAISTKNNNLFYYNIENDECEVKRIDSSIGEFVKLAYLNNELFMPNRRDRKLQGFDPRNLKLVFESRQKDFPSCKIEGVLSKYLVVDLIEKAEIWLYDISNQQKEVIPLKREFQKTALHSPFLTVQEGPVVNNGEALYFDASNYEMLRISNEGVVETFSLEIKEEELKKMSAELENTNPYLMETEENELYGLCNWKKLIHNDLEKEKNGKQNVGETIWKEIYERI